MAKLYWRIKRDGKWTWVAATPENTSYDLSMEREIYDGPHRCIDAIYIEEEKLEVEKPEVIAVEEEYYSDAIDKVCFACETVGEEHCNVHRQYE